jgi:tetratricopeptide (TPR) repeat protein
MGTSLAYTGDLVDGRAHYDHAVALYDPAVDRPQAARFGQDAGVSVLSYRARTLWVLGYPGTALADTARALKDAREIGQASGLMIALAYASRIHIHCGNYSAAAALADELVATADEKGSLFWKMLGILNQGCTLALSGKASEAIQIIPSAINAYQSTGATLFAPWHLSNLASAYADLGQFDESYRCIGEATAAADTTKERWCEADIHRIAGEIALISPEADVAKAEAHFDRAVAIARAQQAKGLGAARDDEHGAHLARSGEAAAGPRSPRPRLRLVH